MRPFKIAELKKINELPSNDSQSWVVDAEGSIAFLRLNSENDDIVIYASGSSVLIHGVLAPTAKLTPPDGKDLQDNNIPMPDDSWRIQQVWGGGEGHRMYLEAPLSSRLRPCGVSLNLNVHEVLCRANKPEVSTGGV